jgi:hypothetical protein
MSGFPIKKVLFLLLTACLGALLQGCAPSVYPKFYENSNAQLIDKSIHTLDVGSLFSFLEKKSKVAVQNLETNPGAYDDRLPNYLVEQFFLSSLLQAGYGPVERDPEVMQNNVFEGSTTRENSDYLLSYRVLDCGIYYDDISSRSKICERVSQIRVQVRLEAVKSGLILYSGDLQARQKDIVDKKYRKRHEKVTFVFYDFTHPQLPAALPPPVLATAKTIGGAGPAGKDKLAAGDENGEKSLLTKAKKLWAGFFAKKEEAIKEEPATEKPIKEESAKEEPAKTESTKSACHSKYLVFAGMGFQKRYYLINNSIVKQTPSCLYGGGQINLLYNDFIKIEKLPVDFFVGGDITLSSPVHMLGAAAIDSLKNLQNSYCATLSVKAPLPILTLFSTFGLGLADNFITRNSNFNGSGNPSLSGSGFKRQPQSFLSVGAEIGLPIKELKIGAIAEVRKELIKGWISGTYNNGTPWSVRSDNTSLQYRVGLFLSIIDKK